MAGSNTYAYTTPEEWKEIKEALDSGKLGIGGYTDFYVHNNNKVIFIENKHCCEQLYEGSFAYLSMTFPCTLFEIDYNEEDNKGTTWFLDGIEYDSRPTKETVAQIVKREAEKYKDQPGDKGEGARHTIWFEEGKLIVDDDTSMGQGDTKDWIDVVKAYCGALHTVALLADGMVVACGVNANGQCNIDLGGKKAKAVACGPYYTLVTLEDGTEVVFGKVENESTRMYPRG